MLCYDYYTKNKQEVDELQEADYGGSDKRKEDYYFIQYTAQECEQYFNGRTPIWGRSLVEGKILCNQLQLENFVVIEMLRDPETRKLVSSYHLSTKDGYRGTDATKAKELLQTKLPVIVNAQGNLHFVPLYIKKGTTNPKERSEIKDRTNNAESYQECKTEDKKPEDEKTGLQEEELFSTAIENKIQAAFEDLTNLMQINLLNGNQEKLIKKKLRSINKLLQELEEEGKGSYKYFKYLYHIQNATYLRAISNPKASSQEKLAQKLEKKYIEYTLEQKEPSFTAKQELIVAENESQRDESFVRKNWKHYTSKEIETIFFVLKFLTEEFAGYITKFLLDITTRLPINFDAYLQLSVIEKGFSGLIDEMQINVHENKKNIPEKEIQALNSKIDSLRIIFNNKVYQNRLKFLHNLLSSTAPEKFLFSAWPLTEENIKNGFRKLYLSFHPDKMKWLPEDSKHLTHEIGKLINFTREKLLSKLKEEIYYENEAAKYLNYKNEADHYFNIGKDYKNATKRKWHKLKVLKLQDISNLSALELKERSEQYFYESQEKYRACCKIVDQQKTISLQVNFRDRIALCLYHCGGNIQAQLYALGAIRLIIKNSNKATSSDLYKATEILEKVKGKNACKDIVTDIVLRVNAGALSSTVAEQYSYTDKEKIKQSIDQQIERIINLLILNYDSKLVNYLSSPKDILRSKERGGFYRSLAPGASLAGLSIGALFVNNSIKMEPSDDPYGPIMFFGGLFTMFFGIIGGAALLDKGTYLIKEPIVREKFNSILIEAIKLYNKKHYQEFIQALFREYKEGTSLLNLKTSTDIIDTDRIIQSMQEHGFRPDGIAYLLNAIGEALSSGKLKIENMTQNDLTSRARQLFYACSSQKLSKQANDLDNIIRNFRLESNKIYLNKDKNTNSVSNTDDIASGYMQDHFKDAQEMPFTSRLEEVQNVAKLNIVTTRIIRGGSDAEEERLAKELIGEVRSSSNKNHSFISGARARARLEALEDFLWVITGEKPTEDSDNPIAKQSEPVPAPQEEDNTYIKEAKKYVLQAKEMAKLSHLKSLPDWQNAKENYQHAFNLNKNNTFAILGIGRWFIELSKYQAALNFLNSNTCNELVKQADYWILKCIAYRKESNYNKAKECIIEALREDPKSNEADKEKKIIERLQKNDICSLLDFYKENKPQSTQENMSYRRRDERPYYNIVTIDGGGIRGIMPALWLSEIERLTRKPIAHSFNMTAGTSTGAIIAAGLVTSEIEYICKETDTDNENILERVSTYNPRYAAIDIVELYREEGPSIFTTTGSWFFGNKLSPKYTPDGRRNLFTKYFGNITLDKALTDIVIIASSHTDRYQTYTFDRKKSLADSSCNVKVVDGLMANTAAPTYFPEHTIPGRGIFSDGGIQANNPADWAYVKALEYGVPSSKIFMLSLGTGACVPDALKPGFTDGQMYWAMNFPAFSLSVQEGNTDVKMHGYLKNRYQRWQAWMENPIALDAYRQKDIHNLIEIGRQTIEEMHNSEENEIGKLVELLDRDKMI